MVIEATRNGRAEINRTASGLSITIPSKKNIFLIIFMSAWLGTWAFALVTVAGNLFSSGKAAPQGFAIFWLVGWTLGGLWASTILGWNLVGKEIITVNPSLMKLDKSVGWIHSRKTFNTTQVKEIRVLDKPASPMLGQQDDMFFFRSGRIAFDYGMKTYRFAQGIEEAEARYLINLMKESGYVEK